MPNIDVNDRDRYHRDENYSKNDEILWGDNWLMVKLGFGPNY